VLGTPLLWPALRDGTYYNVDRLPPTDGHYRRTVNPLDPRSRPAWSWSSAAPSSRPAVPDAYTSQPALRHLNAEDPNHGYEVVNAGVDGAVSARSWRG